MTKWNEIKNFYIDKGFKIFPVKENTKLPLINNWLNDCSSDYMQCLYWFNNGNNNVGLPANPNNLFILDLDVHDENKNGVENFKKLLLDLNLETGINTLIQKTPSGGLHIIFKSDEDLEQIVNCSNAFPDYPGIDIRTTGYILVYPSEIYGKQYKYENDNEINIMPDKLKEYIMYIKGLSKKAKDKEPYKKPINVEIGDRDNQLFSYINNIYYKTSLDYEEVLVLAKYFNENILEKPFSEKTVEYKVKKAFEKNRDIYIHVKINDE